MKKTKLLTSIAALALVISLGACEVYVDVGDVDVGVDVNPNDSTEPDEGGTTDTDTDTNPGTGEGGEGGDTGGEGGDTGTGSGGDENPNPGTGEGGEVTGVAVDCALYGDFTDSSWKESPDVSSKYYIPAETVHYEVTVEVPTKEELTYEPAFRVVEYGTYNLVAGYESLDTTNSTGVTGANGSEGNIGLEGGTYDLVFDFGETNTILVTLQEEQEGETGEDDDAAIAEAILDAVNEGISWDAFHGEYIDEGYDERETVYLTEDEDGMYGSIIDTEDDEVTFAYYYQDGKEYEYAANSDVYSVDDQWEEYSDHLDEYIEEQLDGAEDFDLDSDTYELKEYGDGYELIFTTDFMGYYEYEYIYIVDEDFNVTALAYGEYFAGDLEGWYAEETTFDKVAASMADFDATLWDEEEEEDTFPYTIGETYWFGYEYNNKLYSFTGAIASSYYGGVTTETNGAVSVTLGEAEGGYTLSFNDSATKSTQYIKFVENSSNRNFSFSSEEFVWEYNATYDTFVALDSTNDYVFIGNYYGSSTYDELRVSSIGYLDGTKSSSNTQYPAHLYAQDTPTELTITGGRESLYVGNTVKLGIEVANGANHDVTWSSSNPSCISVDTYGTIEALALAESVTITATSVKDENVTASINIAVVEATQEEVKLCSYDFSKATSNANSVAANVLKTAFDESFVAGQVSSSVITAVSDVTKISTQAGGSGTNTNLQLSTDCLKFGTSGNAGSFNATTSNTITKIELQAAGWSGTQTLTINGVQQSITQSAGSVSAVDNLNTYTYEIAEATSIAFSSSERVLVFNMTFYGYL